MLPLRTLGLRALATLALAAVVAGIATRCAGTQCELNSDCGEHAHCVANRCETDCRADRDCPTRRPYCNVNGVCTATMPPPDNGPDARDVVIQDVPMPPPDVPTPPPDVPTAARRAGHRYQPVPRRLHRQQRLRLGGVHHHLPALLHPRLQRT
jgi:hypothetical protein